MPELDAQYICSMFEQADNASSNASKGKIFEDLMEYIFNQIPGCEVYERNSLNNFSTEETDLILWAENTRFGIGFLGNPIFVECKYYNSPIDGQVINGFRARLENAGLKYGILVTTVGITGDADNATRGHFSLLMGIPRGTIIIVLTRDDILELKTTKQLREKIKFRIIGLTKHQLAVS